MDRRYLLFCGFAVVVGVDAGVDPVIAGVVAAHRGGHGSPLFVIAVAFVVVVLVEVAEMLFLISLALMLLTVASSSGSSGYSIVYQSYLICCHQLANNNHERSAPFRRGKR